MEVPALQYVPREWGALCGPLGSLLMEFRPTFPLCRSNLPASRCRHSVPPAVSGRRVCRQTAQNDNRFVQIFQFLLRVGTFDS